MQQVPNGSWYVDMGREVLGRWHATDQSYPQMLNRSVQQPFPVLPTYSRGRDVGNMTHGNLMIDPPFYAPSELSENNFEEYENLNFMTALNKPPDEVDIWESSNGSSIYQMGSSALKKELIFEIPDSDRESTDWSQKSVKLWEPRDTMYWMLAVAHDHKWDCDNVDISQFCSIDGTTLCSMSEIDFVTREPKHGSDLFNALQVLKQGYQQQMTKLPSYPVLKEEDADRCTLHLDINMENTHLGVHHSINRLSSPNVSGKGSKLSTAVQAHGVKRKVGRPRLSGKKSRNPEKKTGRLWEFIRDLLLNRDYCPSLICWENHDEGVFRFVRSEKVAELWGTRKENPKMTYEKLSRAMRYYYRSQVLLPVLGRRLVYKFGPTATGWRTSNPNFRLPNSHL